MTLADLILEILRHGPQPRTALECAAAERGWAAGSVAMALWTLKRQGRIVHMQRASRHRRAIYGIGETK